MANNCLVTKLKEVVDNSNLVSLGCFRVNVNSQSAAANSRTILIQNVHYSDYADLNANDINSLLLDDGEYQLEISEKYTLLKLAAIDISNAVWGIDINDIAYSDDLADIRLTSKKNYGDIKSLSSALTVLINNTNLIGDISVFNGKALLPAENNRVLIEKTNVTGDIINLASVSSGVVLLSLENTNIYGTVESLVGAMSRSTGKIWVAGRNTGITYNGQTFNELNIQYVNYDFETGEYATS